ncbi:MAG TPA: SDR family oxidoreductase [Methylorubrum populi]|uniref:SDR family oxidoreductase n=1 Tax=Methylorubrum populi TaxID=223967 RepID=A0A921JF49_9HYPH|nr:SDR family oxidoreductase [Methylorubrum populi]
MWHRRHSRSDQINRQRIDGLFPIVSAYKPGGAGETSLARILLTGATGLIGGAILHQALERDDGRQWVCLVRCANADQGRQRVAARLARFTDAFTAQRLVRRAEIVPGDFTQADRDHDARLDDVTHILHLAADTSYFGDDRLFQTNRDGTLALARRAARMRNLRRFLHIGTAMSCGADAGSLVAEAQPDPAARHLVPYTASKAAAEEALAAEHPDLPLVVARPSIVVGHSTLGAGPSSSILWLVRAADRLRLLPCRPESCCDIIPADWAAEALITLLLKPDLAHNLYHVSAGLPSRTRWSELNRAFEAAEPSDGVRTLSSFDLDDRTVLRERFRAVFGLDSPLKRTMLRATRAYFGFCALDMTFANDRLLGEGVAPAPALTEYLSTCLANSDSILEQFADDIEMFAPTALQAPLAGPHTAELPQAVVA